MAIYSLLKNIKALSNTPFSTGKLLVVHSPSSLVLNSLEILYAFTGSTDLIDVLSQLKRTAFLEHEL